MLSSGSAVAAVALVDEAVGDDGGTAHVKDGGGSGGEGFGRPMAEEVVGCHALGYLQ